ncbi:MAG: cysteine desulfurase [Bacteroidota bacterium]
MHTATAPFDVQRIRADFPILSREVHGRPLVYLDNAATTQKPQVVIDRIARYYAEENANVHRGVHFLSAEGTEAFEAARATIAGFIGAPSPREVVFTRGTTEAINLVAHGFAEAVLREGDEIVVTGLEHHANIVPWQMAAERTGARLRVLPMTPEGDLDTSRLGEVLTEATRIVCVSHTSNALGSVSPLREVTEAARAVGAAVLVDGAQATPHAPVDVQALGVDFFVFSGHKTYGPMGIGVLWGREAWLDRLPPYQGGGDMIDTVTFERTTYAGLPSKFEAGTPNVAGVLGLAAAVDYLTRLGMEHVATHEADLVAYAVAQLEALGGVRFIGTPRERASAVSFLLEGLHPYDTGTVLDRLGIAVRTGQHCAQPVMDAFGVSGTVRASFALYNTRDEIDALCDGLRQVRDLFG